MNLDWIGWILFLMFFGLVSMPWWVIVIQIVWGDPYGPFVGDDTSSDPTSVDTRNFVFVRDLSPDEGDDGDDVDLDRDPDGIEIPDGGECLGVFDPF